MNRKQLLILLVAAAIMAGAGIKLYQQRKGNWSETGSASGKLLKDFPVNDVTRITFRQASGELNLEKKDDTWKVRERADFPANFDEIRDFLRKIGDMKVTTPVEVGPSKLSVLELLPPEKGAQSGTLVEFRDKAGKVLTSLLVGKKSMKQAPANAGPMGGGGSWPDGRYLMVGTDIKSVCQIGDPLNNVEAKAEPWVAKDFFKVEKVKSVRVDYSVASNSWAIARASETNDWNLVETKPGEVLDVSKASSASSALASPSFADVGMPNAKPEETGLNEPTKLELTTFEGFTYQLKVGKKTPENNYHLAFQVTGQFPSERTAGKDEKAEDKTRLDKEFQDNLKKLQEKLNQEKKLSAWTYQVTQWSLDALLKERKDLFVEKKEEPKKEDAPK